MYPRLGTPALQQGKFRNGNMAVQYTCMMLTFYRTPAVFFCDVMM